MGIEGVINSLYYAIKRANYSLVNASKCPAIQNTALQTNGRSDCATTGAAQAQRKVMGIVGGHWCMPLSRLEHGRDPCCR